MSKTLILNDTEPRLGWLLEGESRYQVHTDFLDFIFQPRHIERVQVWDKMSTDQRYRHGPRLSQRWWNFLAYRESKPVRYYFYVATRDSFMRIEVSKDVHLRTGLEDFVTIEYQRSRFNCCQKGRLLN